MKKINRRKFVTTSTQLTAAAALGSRARLVDEQSQAFEKIRHPLDVLEREQIKITDIKVTPLSYVPSDGRDLWGVSKYVVWKTDSALVEVRTDQGITGIGEGSPYSDPSKIKAYTDKHVTPAMIGKNPFDVDYLCSGGPWRDYLARAAWAGVQNACWDIIGKSKGEPVYKLLATDCDPINPMPIYASGGVNHKWYEDGASQLIEEAL
ncbi:MAG: hypothetical protein HKN87_04090, partial [Saprospiraceae bacterium]|nr:hypothetical protein [Saprospiraceae bacterium]